MALSSWRHFFVIVATTRTVDFESCVCEMNPQTLLSRVSFSTSHLAATHFVTYLCSYC